MLRLALLTVLLGVEARANGAEGSPCTWGAYNGTCLNAHKCFIFIIDRMEGKHPPICSYKGKIPIVCCTECPILHVNEIDDYVFNYNVGLMVKNGKKYWDACINYVDKLPYLGKQSYSHKITKGWNDKDKCHGFGVSGLAPSGGEDTHRGQYPFMALLGYGSDMDSAEWLCGGSLISETFILTAAHCISTPRLGPVKFAALGVWKRSEPNELWQRYNVRRVVPHPEYKSPAKYHDIALLETDQPVDFHPGCMPACLHSGDQRYMPVGHNNNNIFALGWGALGPGKHLADILQKVYLDRFSDAECAAIYQPSRLLKDGYNTTTQVCYGDQDRPRDTCEGDSGGPLIYNNMENATVGVGYTILAVTSYGVQCGEAGGAGIYTRVAHYLPWIESVVWP